MRSDNPVAAAVERYNSDPLNLVQIVRETQAALGWLSRETQGEIAERLKIPVNRVDSVVTFYAFFYDKPRGAYRLLISDNVTDRMQGNQALLARLLGRFGVKRGEVVRRRPRQRRPHLVHRHGRPGASDAGQQHRRCRVSAKRASTRSPN